MRKGDTVAVGRSRAWAEGWVAVGMVVPPPWLAVGWAVCRRQLPVGREVAGCCILSCGVVGGRTGLAAVAGLLRLPPPGCIMVAIPLANGDPPSTLFQGDPAPPPGILETGVT